MKGRRIEWLFATLAVMWIWIGVVGFWAFCYGN